MADFDIDALARKIGRLVGGIDANVELRVRIEKPAEARQSHFVDRLGVARTIRDFEDKIPPDVLRGVGDPVDVLGDHLEIALAGFRQHHAAPGLHHQRRAEMDLQGGDLLADGRGRDAEFLSRSRNAPGPGGGVETVMARSGRCIGSFSQAKPKRRLNQLAWRAASVAEDRCPAKFRMGRDGHTAAASVG